MRSYPVFIVILSLAAGTALAATTSDKDKDAKAAASHATDQKAKAKTSGHPLPSSPSDPNAGVNEQGTPNTTVTNGGDLAH